MTTAPPLKCSEVIQQLWDYLDGELEGTRWDSVRTHLETCDGCRSHVEFCRSFHEQVSRTAMDPAEVAALRSRISALLK